MSTADRGRPATLSRVVVAGAQTAGLAVAETLRADGFAGDLVLVGAERRPPYHRPALSKQVLRDGRAGPEPSVLDEPRADRLGLDLRLGSRAVGLDARRRLLITDRGPIGYGDLVIATGAAAIRPGWAEPWPRDVLVLRTLDDALAIADRLGPAVRVAVVGAGLLGSELAAAARGRGAEVTLIGRAGGFRLGAAGGGFSDCIAALHEANGVRLRLGTRVISVERTPRGPSVVLDLGAPVPADLVVVAVGARPAVDWLAGTGLLSGGRLLAGPDGRVADHVYVAGDAGTWWDPTVGRHVGHGHQLTAIEQGRAVARTLTNGGAGPVPVPFFWTELYGERVQAYGRFTDTTGPDVIDGDPTARRAVWGFRRHGRLTGLVGWNAGREFRARRAELAAADELVPNEGIR